MIRTLASLAALAASAKASSCSLSGGNYYCNEVSQIQFDGVSFSGSYNQITGMDSTSGTCSSQQAAYSGTLAPFDEGLSVHFRGPIELLQFGVYTKSSSSKREAAEHHVHKREPAMVTAYEHVTAYVTVDENGNLLTTSSAETVEVPQQITSAAGAATTAATSTGGATTAKTTSDAFGAGVSALNYNYNHQDESSATGPSSVSTSAAAAATNTVSSGAWSQAAFYDASAGSASGLTFLNNLGGSGSGVFDYTFGNSLSYCAADGVSAAGSAQTLSKTTLPSNKEVIIFSDNECTDSTCGFSREGIPAFRGFEGTEKIFVFEFSMPTATDSASYNYDMPAIWLLNAQIPRTLQYGKESCSCWSTGCGEFDLFEILTAGENRLISTIHTGLGKGAGCSDYIQRPISGSIKAAAIFDGSTVTLTVLDDSVTFGSSLSDSDIAGWLSSTKSSSSLVNV